MAGATRSAFAAMVSAGLRAADDGKKLPSTTNRLPMSWLRLDRSSPCHSRSQGETLYETGQEQHWESPDSLLFLTTFRR
jgi:hypothetical protein